MNKKDDEIFSTVRSLSSLTSAGAVHISNSQYVSATLPAAFFICC